ncbi:MAG: hypothetical protein UR34_C0011G0010 [candidate division WS6 bacterium GW2011_GWC1_33_20]|uniref:Uncharacterized protein n=1 Tax=candidate division WS6 bacterium GW2011_GWC1_33_20 TaxID=1619089 RepID=A0A0F9ZXP5_9BACT|nr:MAG: hypothetical protein UR34_C0011G0010 [candidate division WS6 bacterium GW2011_GWC1_33_20]
MVSKEFIKKLNTIINTENQFSEEEILYIGESLIEFYKTIEKILNQYGNGKSIKDREKEI